jgi:hypothetical protein
MKTTSKKIIASFFLGCLLLAAGTASAGNGLNPTVDPGNGTAPVQQVATYVNGLGYSVQSVSPANDGTGNLVVTLQSGGHLVVAPMPTGIIVIEAHP